MNSIKKRKLRKIIKVAGKELCEWVLIAIMMWITIEAMWITFEKRFTYKECEVWKTRECGE